MPLRARRKHPTSRYLGALTNYLILLTLPAIAVGYVIYYGASALSAAVRRYRVNVRGHGGSVVALAIGHLFEAMPEFPPL